MKKSFAVTLILLLLFSAGCAPNTNLPDKENTTPNTDGYNTSTNNTIADTTDDNSVVEPQFDENAPLFFCQDRADIEGDRYTVYYYNYKGDLLNSTESVQIGFYAQNGLAPAYDPLTGRYGFVDKSGVFAIDPQWAYAAAFSKDDVALVAMQNEQTYSRKYGFINKKGEAVIPCIYDRATSFFPRGVALIGIAKTPNKSYEDSEEAIVDVKYPYLYGVVDKKGNVIIEPQYDYIEQVTGDYIICKSEVIGKTVIYDLSGNVVLEHNDAFIDATHYQKYFAEGEVLIRHTKDGDDLKVEVYDGTQFVELIENASIEKRRVATTTMGYGYGVVSGNETVIPFEYDSILKVGDYYVARKAKNGEKSNQLLDIYNESFQKTAENLEYNYDILRNQNFGDKIALPSGYFDVYIYDKDLDENLHGIIDATGQIIVPLLYYRGINLHTYEGFGGWFSFN